MLNRIFALIKKEFLQLSRDKSLIFILLFFPIMLLVIFGYAVNFDVKNISFKVYDADNSEYSRQFVAQLNSSEYFSFNGYLESSKAIDEDLDKGKSQFIISLPKSFSDRLTSGKEQAQIQFLIDGVDGNTSTIIQNYILSAVSSFSQKITAEQLQKYGRKLEMPVKIESRFWFNPDLQTTLFLIPGLIAIILIIIAVVTVALSLVREKERGTIEQLNVSSLNTIELLLGKLTPYYIISIMEAGLILFAGFILFGIVVQGSYLLLIFTTLIFIFSATSMGIFISVISDSQQIAFSVATFATLLPSTILSGFIFPIESMPYVIQVLTNVTPVKFYLVALRAIIIKGVGISLFWEQLLYLAVFGSIFILLSTIVSIKKQKKS